MKRILSLLLVFAFVAVNAQSIKVYLPKWENQVCPENGFELTNATFDGNRTTKTNSQNSTKESGFLYRTLKPLIVKIDAPSGVDEVNIIVSGKDIGILNAPQGTTFKTKGSATVPVLSSTQTVYVENPYRFFSECEIINNISYDGTERYHIDNYTSFVKSQYFHKDIVEKGQDKKFNIGGNGETYITLLALEEGSYTIAVSDAKNPTNANTVVSHINFKDGNDQLTCKCDYDLELAVYPSKSPLVYDNKTSKCPTVTFYAEIFNEGNQTMDLSEVLIKFEEVGDWVSGAQKFVIQNARVNRENKKSLAPNEKVTVEMDWNLIKTGSQELIIDDSKLKQMVSIGKMNVTIIYPTSPENGKSAEGDVTISKEFAGGILAGIGTKFEANGTKVVFNTSGEAESLLGIVGKAVSPDGAHCLEAHTDTDGVFVTDLYGGNAFRVEKYENKVVYRLYDGKRMIKEATLMIKK